MTSASTRLTHSTLVVGLTGDNELVHSAALPDPGALAALASAVGATSKEDAVVRAPGTAVGCDVVVFTGVGEDANPEALRRAAGSVTRQLKGVEDLLVALPSDEPELLGAVAEGLAYGAYRFERYTSRPGAVSSARILVSRPKDRALKDALARAVILAEATALARDLINTAPADLSPEAFADIAVEQGKANRLKVTVLDESALAREGYGGIVGVGQGSSRPPRLVKVDYAPRSARFHAALVGKGITFDSGGLSLKPPKSMETMKSDMSGAAAVLAAVVAAARLRLDVRVTAWLALAENMPSATATRPSDVLTMRDGQTVEVLNTDAEGRLVLADALVAAREDGPDVLVDIATLTGAQVLAFGTRTGAAMGSEDVRSDIVAAADAAGEHFWPMPLPEYLNATMTSQVADFANMGAREGGMLVAGHFLRRFAGDTPWAHLDIAGPAFADSEWGYNGKGGTAFGVRTFVNYLENH